MNYYPFHIGDFESATIHLSWDEDMAYRRLLDAYYKLEGPLPGNVAAVYRLVRATDKRQRAAVDTVLAEFFIKSADGYHNERCDEEIAKAVDKRSKASASAKAKWGHANAMRSHTDRTADAERTQSEGNAPNPNLRKDTDRPSTADIPVLREDWALLEARLREAAGWQNEPAPRLAVVGPIAALIEAGADLDADILPTVRALAPGVRNRTTWKYFVQPIKDAVADRKAAGTIPEGGKSNVRPRAGSMADAFAQFDAAFDRRLAEIDVGTGEGNSPADIIPLPRLREGNA